MNGVDVAIIKSSNETRACEAASTERMKTQSKPVIIVHIEALEADTRLVEQALVDAGLTPDCQRVTSEEGLRQVLASGVCEIVLCSDQVPGLSWQMALDHVHAWDHDLPFIVLSSTTDEELAVEAMRRGARDFLRRGSLARLAPVIERELREARARRERLVLEEHLFRIAKDESIGRLAGGVAHDFNNLLTAILGYADLARRRSGADAILDGHLRRILDAAKRGAGLTQQLLAFARKQVVRPEPFDLRETLRRIGDLLPVLIGENNELQITMPPDELVVQGDPGQIEQVVMNLAVNARDAMQLGGRLTLKAERWSPDPFGAAPPHLESGEYALITIQDTGTGMDERVKARIFEPFFTTKEPGNGTGLGLSMAWGIVHQAKGTIQVDSVLGQGSTFRIFLPLAIRGQTSRVRRPVSGRLDAGGGETILLVEDEGAIRELETDLLHTLGYRVLIACNGEEALALADAGQEFAAVVTDLVMPRLGGEALVARLRLKRPLLRVLLTSGYPENIAVRDGGLEANTSFLQKPFSPAELARAVRQLLQAPGESG